VPILPIAAILAVGDDVEPDLLLHGDDLADCLVFDGAQVGGGDAAFGEIVPAGQQIVRTQETADGFGADVRHDVASILQRAGSLTAGVVSNSTLWSSPSSRSTLRM
jgi:hypothetical protein